MDTASIDFFESFHEQVLRAPHAIAVIHGDERISYVELDRRSNGIARWLGQQGVTTDVVVGIRIERSIALIAAILGILKAGGAYLYLDPEFPAERLASMCTDAQAHMVLTSIRGLPDAPRFDVARDVRWAASYVVYTSGSSGRPKGVAVGRGALARVALALRHAYGVNAGDRVLQFASPSWDTMVEEVFPTLAAGATVVLRSAEMIETRGFLRGCASHGITLANLPTAFWHRLVADLDEEGLSVPSTLRTVIIGGEPAAPDRIAAWHAGAGRGTRLLNTYGLTEAAAVCTVTELRSAESSTPIGVPLPHVSVSIRNDALDLVPDGSLGEICIGGEGLARGYLGQPAATAQKFVPDAASPMGGARLYRTGDRGFRRPDGQFVCVGRMDAQIKVGGVRVEPGEVEAIVRQHPRVREAVAVAHRTDGDARLVVYVVLHAQGARSAAEIRAFARAHLPASIVPAIVLLDALPRTESGKIDRNALHAPAPTASDTGTEHPLEAALCALAGEVLSGGAAQPTDDFFDLGGNSLLATRFIVRARRELGLHITFEQMLLARTIRAMAGAAESHRGIAVGEGSVSRATPDRIGTTSFLQERHWRLNRKSPASTAYNLAWMLHIHGELDTGLLDDVLLALVDRHEPMRITFTEEAGAVRAIVRPRPRTALRVLRGPSAPRTDDEVTAFAARDAATPFDLAEGLPFRATLIPRADRQSTLVVTVHHVAIDGWSLGVLAHDAEQLYASLRHRTAPSLQPLPVTYADFAVWQRDMAGSESEEMQIAYWRRQLRNAPPALTLPFDRPRPANPSFHGGRVRRTWSHATWATVRAVAREHGVTPFMVLLATFAASLGAWSGQEDLVIGTPIAGRVRPELEPLVGVFLNGLSLRIDLSGSPTFTELLHRVRTVTLGGFANADVPIARVVEALQLPAGNLQLFQVMLVLQNAPFTAPAFEGLQVSAEEVERDSAFYDLALEVEESAQGMALVWQYSTDLFDRNTIERFASDFDTRTSRALA